MVVEHFEDIVKEFDRNYTELCGAINENGQSSFARLRELENEHQEKFTEAVVGMYERFNKGDMDEVDDEIRDVCFLIFNDNPLISNSIVFSGVYIYSL